MKFNYSEWFFSKEKHIAGVSLVLDDDRFNDYRYLYLYLGFKFFTIIIIFESKK